ncbi:uncharacterized protein LOC127733413 [Mytilus californianus]|uniref:uncharacterized protein LOC127733413 n=1 Tax=Mytilus californianus TaxID=6549 RepID=UPI002247C70E|nr:uncharacterized protein LOC127733413 [Mytilus californianus]
MARIVTIPMTSLNTHLTYDNIYCAQCRNDYLTVKNSSIRVCSDRYLQLISEVPNENIKLPMFIIRAIST